MTPSGLPSLRIAGDALEDALDPVAGARQFVSLDRVKDAKHVILFGAGLGYRVQHLRQLGVAAPIVFEPDAKVLELAKRHGANRLDDARIFTHLAPALTYLVGSTTPNDNVILLAPPAYQRAFPKAYRDLVAMLTELEGITVLRKNTFEDRYVPTLQTALDNLHLLAEMPLALSLNKPMKGKPAFIVSAGPSLNRNAELLGQAAERGFVMPVNSAAPVVSSVGASLDVLVALEALGVPPSVKHSLDQAEMLALDLSAHPDIFAHAKPQRCLLYYSSSPPYHWLGQRTGVPPLLFGSSVATAAFALAANWGADPIVLVGQDLAYTGGNMYARGSAHSGLRVAGNADVIELETSAERDALFTRRGLTPPPRYQRKLSVEAWGGEGSVVTTYDMCSFRRWFEAAAHALSGEARLINATEGGARIVGFEELSLQKVLSDLPVLEEDKRFATHCTPSLAQATAEDVKRLIHDGSVRLARAARRRLTLRGQAALRAEQHVRRCVASAPFADAVAFPRIDDLRERIDLTLAQRTRLTYQILADSAELVVAHTRPTPKATASAPMMAKASSL